MSESNDVRVQVREKYGALAEGQGSCCGGTSCCSDDVLTQIGYTAEQSAAIPEGANLGLGCGNPLAHAALRPGETVLDLGSGAGLDVFLASREVGPTGHVIGVDMTPAMIEKARANAQRGGYANVEFRLGEIESLPLANNSVDVIISNCVINLSPDKEQVFREAFRVLRPGGRLLISDLVLAGPLPEAVQKSVEAWVGCIAGAMQRDDYLQAARTAGFVEVEVVQEDGYTVGDDLAGNDQERAALRVVRSAKVRARKPPGRGCC